MHEPEWESLLAANEVDAVVVAHSTDRELRADGVRVSVFKQQTSPKGGNWVDAQVDPRTNIDIENAILTRARQLRIAGGS